MQDREILLTAAQDYWSKGLNPIPCSSEKRPIGTWTEFRDIPTTPNQFKQRLNGGAYGIGIITGLGSGNLEVIDIDHKYDLTGNLVNNYLRLIADHDSSLFDSLHIVKTGTHGFHLYYRCEEIEGNEKLAQRPTTEEERAINPKEKTKVLIETRGQGGFLVCPPTKGYTIWQENTIPLIKTECRQPRSSAVWN